MTVILQFDPALLCPGRMDVHINMSDCTPCGFKLLARNYLGIKNHVLFDEVDNLIEAGKATPAEVAEQLLKNDDTDVSLQGLIDFMHRKIKENERELKLKRISKKLLSQRRFKGNVEEKGDSISS